MYVFFFQAEDGIRDLTVTGVQTCALPISVCYPHALAFCITRYRFEAGRNAGHAFPQETIVIALEFAQQPDQRSEEHTSELQSQSNLVCRLLLEKKKYRRK